MGGVAYLLHFDKPVNAGRTARHYLGYAESDGSLAARLDQHRRGQGVRIVAALMSREGDFEVARTWPDADRSTERRLKNYKNAPGRLCPVCRQADNGGAERPELEAEPMTDVSIAIHPFISWLGHQWWFVGGLLVVGLAASEAARHSEQ